jgi:hypothetical protein
MELFDPKEFLVTHAVCLSDRVTIVGYQSRLLVIAAEYEISGYGSQLHKLGNKVYTLSSDGSWEEDAISPLPDDPFLLNMFACSEGDSLIVAWKTDNHVKLLVYYDSTWKMRDGPDRAMGNHSNIIICDQAVFLTNCVEYPLFHTISLDELQLSSTPKWINIQNIPRAHSNLVSLCGHLTLVFKLSSSVRVVQYLPASSTWIELGDLDFLFHGLPSIVSVSDTRLGLIGQMRMDSKTVNPATECAAIQFFEHLTTLAPPEVIGKLGTLFVDTEGLFAWILLW